MILPLQLTDALLRPDADQGKSGVPGPLVEAVPRAMGVSLARGLAVQAAPVPAVQGVLHGEQVRPQLGRVPALGRREALAERGLQLADAFFDRAVVLRIASGADAALSQLQAVGGRVDLVLTDLAMPGVSGAQLVEQLARLHPRLPVLMMTGADVGLKLPPELLPANPISDMDEFAPELFLKLPPEVKQLAKGVIAKPFTAEMLLHAVALVLAKR